MGPFRAVTAPHTGRSPDDKFFVRRAETEGDIDWGAVNRPIEPAHFDALLADVQAYLSEQRELFVQDLYCGADPAYRLSVRYVSPSAWHMAFVRNMFIRPEPTSSSRPSRRTSPCCTRRRCRPIRRATARAAAPSSCSTSPSRMILIGGTRYAGELKKAMFTVMNYYLPKQGVLSMHCSANIGAAGDTALFFGLSGTGKTTLSADPSALAHRRRRARLVRRGRLQLRGRLLRQGDQPLRRERAGHLSHHADVRHDPRERRARSGDAHGALRRREHHGEHPRVVSAALHPELRARTAAADTRRTSSSSPRIPSACCPRSRDSRATRRCTTSSPATRRSSPARSAA